ncbi:patatin-like phospholipase family protein [Subtercola lobariae]|uniref:Patatin n=1 Tax=Subtercola lobariae TaxID=1588641 RepID=A0A917BBP1_9MICO|nr:patatin-like phospholipase family protein [Subtercola lobariae]GGF34402.1 patatin [Subtercola lobariae]
MNSTPFKTLHVSLETNSNEFGSDEHPHTVVTDFTHSVGERAVVLGGGGAAGNAWLIGVIAGLFDGGIDVTAADLMVGTSAGATAAAQITAARPPQLPQLSQLYEEILSAPVSLPGSAPGRATAAQGHGPVHGPLGSMVDHLQRTNDVIAAADGPVDVRRRLAASVLELDDAFDLERQAQWRATVARRLPSPLWPRQSVLITVVDARTGDPVVFDQHSGIDLVDAVAASTAGGAPFTIGGVPYFDGGYRRSSENADLAVGHRRVLVLSPFGGRTRMPLDWNMHLAPQLDELRASGSAVETVVPDDVAVEAFGGNMMNLAARAPAARAGFSQGRARAAELADFWG